MATAVCSSEDENIVMNLANLASRIGGFVRTGKDNGKNDKLGRAFARFFLMKKRKKKKSQMNDGSYLMLLIVD